MTIRELRSGHDLLKFEFQHEGIWRYRWKFVQIIYSGIYPGRFRARGKIIFGICDFGNGVLLLKFEDQLF